LDDLHDDDDGDDDDFGDGKLEFPRSPLELHHLPYSKNEFFLLYHRVKGQ
jgi:hypothetical protein